MPVKVHKLADELIANGMPKDKAWAIAQSKLGNGTPKKKLTKKKPEKK
jgi:hypothetical protein